MPALPQGHDGDAHDVPDGRPFAARVRAENPARPTAAALRRVLGVSRAHEVTAGGRLVARCFPASGRAGRFPTSTSPTRCRACSSSARSTGLGDEVARKQREDYTREEEALMARKRTKGKVTKNVARKKVTKTASAKPRRGKAAEKPRKPASKTSPPNPAVPRTVESPGAVDLLRAWSPSRYSTR